MYSFSGQLINAQQLRGQLGEALAVSRGRVLLASAYLKMEALEWVATRVKVDVPVQLLARWQPNDLLNGASDIEAYELAREKGWIFFIQEDFHGKVYLVDQQALFIGSANLTTRGLNLYKQGNDEVNVRVKPSPENSAFVERIFQRAVLVDDTIYSQIKKWLDFNKGKVSATSTQSWPEELLQLLKPQFPPDRLLVAECFQTDGAFLLGEEEGLNQVPGALESDLSLLGVLSSGPTTKLKPSYVAERLRATKMYAWLVARLQAAERGELYFGALTAALHNSLLDDPSPFRSEVKALLANLLRWVELSEISEIRIDRPNYSQRIFLNVPPI